MTEKARGRIVFKLERRQNEDKADAQARALARFEAGEQPWDPRELELDGKSNRFWLWRTSKRRRR